MVRNISRQGKIGRRQGKHSGREESSWFLLWKQRVTETLAAKIKESMGGQGQEKQVRVPQRRAQEGYQKAGRRLGNKAALSLCNLVEHHWQKQSQEASIGNSAWVDFAHAADRNVRTVLSPQADAWKRFKKLESAHDPANSTHSVHSENWSQTIQEVKVCHVHRSLFYSS